MADHVYKKVEVVGTSRESLEDAIRTAVNTASKSLRGLDWFEVKEIRGWIEDGGVQHFQVTVAIGFRLET